MIKKIKKVNLLKNGIYVNDVEIYSFTKEQNTADTLKEIYRHLKIDYPKFFKMDNLSKLGFLSTEMLLENIDNKEDVGIVLSTSSSSLETDTVFQKTIQNKENFFPSPSVFVYTLPNIVIGEICIRHKIYGENMMFIIKENELAHFYHQTEKIIQEIDVKQGIIGYLECYNNNFKAEFILVENQ